MNINLTDQWVSNMAKREGDTEIGAGALASDPVCNREPTMTDNAQQTVGTFVRRPAVIDAMQITTERLAAFATSDPKSDVPEWARMAACRGLVGVVYDPHKKPNVLRITTLNGPVDAEVGEWLARGIEGELYPISASVFSAIYEPAI